MVRTYRRLRSQGKGISVVQLGQLHVSGDAWVNVGPVDQSLWFSDGYGDYVRHFLAGMGSVPEWAPSGQTHLLKSTSVITEVKYEMKEVSYAAFDAEGFEVLKLNFTPRRVLADGKSLSMRDELNQSGWKFEPNDGVLRIRRAGAKTVRIMESISHDEVTRAQVQDRHP